jgi:hypothetical protein
LGCLPEFIVSFLELVQTRKGYTLNGKGLDQGIFVVWPIRLRIEESYSLGEHPAPQEGFCL